MSLAAGIALIVFGAILTFALRGGHIGDLDLPAVGVILMLAGVMGDADHREPYRRTADPRGA
jgi:hypothetical protein